MTTWFTSDLHIEHRNIIRLSSRPFDNIEQMNNALVNNWNSVVEDSDTIYILGDFSFKNPTPYIKRLKGNKIFIIGNHDHKKTKGRKLMEPKIDGQRFILCHYPLLQWRQEYYGSIHLHGHNHNNPIEYKKNRINVGVDIWNYTPVSAEQILKHALLM